MARHIDSYNFFVEQEIKDIVNANRTIRSDVDSNFWLECVYASPLKWFRLTFSKGSQTFESAAHNDKTTTMDELAPRCLQWSVVFAT